ncbi:MAG: mycothione reductase [Micrococcales bacterium]|nr:MAG: mycothione reductase [Micrococcales bacterium]PIE27398.1 MAG: mycothione reductase [Micrococcales bacterium]
MPHHDLIIVGAGSGRSLATADALADLDIALVEENKFGGTCLNLGCIPTKMFVIPADRVVQAREARALGVRFDEPQVDWRAIRDRVFGRIDPIEEHHGNEDEQRPHTTVYRASARFTGDRRLALSTGQELTADRVVIAAGSRPMTLPIPALDRVDPASGVHTSDTVLRMDSLPPRMIVVGGGFIACELAHVFDAYGVQVTMVEMTPHLLPAEDDEVRDRITAAFCDRMAVHVSAKVQSAQRRDGVWELAVEGPDGPVSVAAEAVLLAVGRAPNADRLDVAAGGMAVDEAGRVVVDEYQRTSAAGVWALGDVSTRWPLKHVANHEARVVAHNVAVDADLIGGEALSTDHDFVPHAVFTHPQVAAFGPTRRQLEEAGTDYVSASQPYSAIAYGWALEDTAGLLTVYADPGSHRILAAHCIGPQAAAMIQPLVMAASLGLDAGTLARAQYWPHPALTELIENALLKLDFTG